MIEDHNLLIENEHYSNSDKEHKNLVDSTISNEINNGIGASFVLKRTYFATIKDYSIKKTLSIFKKSLFNILIDNQELTFTKNTLSA